TATRIDPAFVRPAEVDLLVGDPTKACERLGWTPKVTFPQLVRLMVEHDCRTVAEEREMERAVTMLRGDR
ncbi:MAG: GDP-mannose 4,6-dehydratase, partial [Firmicutes bacterium]|nr:GDP-mannose 4,6-dehydratase [Bacillota bacterium]